MFAPKQAGGQDLGQFVTKPFKSWGKILQKASVHGTRSYHLSSMTRMTEYLAQYENPSESISVIMDSELQRVIETNQKVLESLIKIVLLCGKQGLALHGHHDDKISWTEDEDVNSNEVTLWNWYNFMPKQILSLLSTLLSPNKIHVMLPKQFKMN